MVKPWYRFIGSDSHSDSDHTSRYFDNSKTGTIVMMPSGDAVPFPSLPLYLPSPYVSAMYNGNIYHFGTTRRSGVTLAIPSLRLDTSMQWYTIAANPSIGGLLCRRAIAIAHCGILLVPPFEQFRSRDDRPADTILYRPDDDSYDRLAWQYPSSSFTTSQSVMMNWFADTLIIIASSSVSGDNSAATLFELRRSLIVRTYDDTTASYIVTLPERVDVADWVPQLHASLPCSFDNLLTSFVTSY